MLAKYIFNIDMALGYLAWALCIATYVWPRLKAMDQVEAHRADRHVQQFPLLRVGLLAAGVCWTEPAAGLRYACGLRRPRHRAARNPRAANGARALPLLAAGVGFQSGRSRRPRHRHGAGGQREPAVSCRAARGRLRDPHSLCTSAFLDAPPRVLSAAATCAHTGSVGWRADVARRD